MVNIPEIWSTDQKYGQQIRNMVNRPKIWSTYQRYCHHTGLDRLDWLNWLDWQGWCGWQGRQGWQGRYMANLKLWITDRADRAYSRIILPTIAYRLQIWNYDWLAHWPTHWLTDSTNYKEMLSHLKKLVTCVTHCVRPSSSKAFFRRRSNLRPREGVSLSGLWTNEPTG